MAQPADLIPLADSILATSTLTLHSQEPKTSSEISLEVKTHSQTSLAITMMILDLEALVDLEVLVVDSVGLDMVEVKRVKEKDKQLREVHLEDSEDLEASVDLMTMMICLEDLKVWVEWEVWEVWDKVPQYRLLHMLMQAEEK